MLEKITSWSFSRWSDYEQCPQKAKYKHIMKMKEPPNEAMARGTAIHTKAEQFLNGTLSKLPAELKLLAAEYKAMKALKPRVEQEWALDSDWKPTGWFDKNAWLRIKMDAEARAKNDATTLLVDDTKTGKPRGSYGEQLSLYALGGFYVYPLIQKIKTRLLFTDHGPTATVEDEFARKDVTILQKAWLKRIRSMLNDTRFAPKPGHYCAWCHFSKGKGGPCKF